MDSVSPQEITLSEEELIELKKAHQEFIKNLQELNRSTSTILAYGKDLEQLIDYLIKEHQIKHVQQVQTSHIEDFKRLLFDLKYTPKSISRKINSIKSFFRFVNRQGWIQHSPAEGVSHPKFESKPPRILSQAEYKALRDAARHDIRTSAVIELLLQTGIRIGELAQLRLKHIKQNEIVVPPYQSQTGRTIPINQSVKAALKNWLAIRPQKSQSDHLFITKTGRPLLVRNIRNSINRYFRLAGIKNAKVNDLRHTWIAHHLEKGTALSFLSQVAGHKRVSTTEKYLNFVKKPAKANHMHLFEL